MARRTASARPGQQFVQRQLNIQPTPDHQARLSGPRDRGARPGAGPLWPGKGSAMTKLKLGPLADDKLVRLTIELPASVHRDPLAYAVILGGLRREFMSKRNGILPTK